MKKIIAFAVLIGLVALAGFMATGCGQSIPQVNTTCSQPKGLTIRGIVFGENLSGNQAQPLAGAVIFLAGDQVNKVTSSDASGQYSFTDLPSNNTGSSSGGYTLVTTKEGYQRKIIADLTFGQGTTAPVPDNSVLTEDIALINNPVVLDISPAPGSVVTAAAQTITVQFNEAMDASSVRPTLTSQGMRTFAIADTQNLTTSWSADGKTLTITTGPLLANKEYQFILDPAASAKDLAGNLLDITGSGDGWGAGGISNEVYNNTGNSSNLNYRTATGGAPGAPSGVLLTVNSKATIDYADAATGGNRVDLSWLAPASGAVTQYRIYVGTSSSGPWSLLDTATRTTLGTNVTVLNTALYGDMYNAQGIHELACVTDTAYFRVAAWNAEGETTSETVSMRDSVKPTITTGTGTVNRNPNTAGIGGTLSAALTNYAAAGSTQNMGCYVAFSEPMTSLTDPTKYTVSGGISVSSATVRLDDNGLTVVELVFASAMAPGATLTVSTSGPTDLSGNVMSSTGNVATIN